MFCIKCGKEITNASIFCSNCGEKVASSMENLKSNSDNSFHERKYQFLPVLSLVFLILSILTFVLSTMGDRGLWYPLNYLSILFSLCANIVALTTLYRKKNNLVLIVGIGSIIVFFIYFVRIINYIQVLSRLFY